MIYNENTYYIGYHRNVRAYGAIPALVFDTICGLVNDPENMTGEISNTTLCELLGITPQGLRKIIQQLISIGWIMKSSTAGRGNKTTYTITEKGKRDCPLCDPEKGKRGFQKRETRFPKKGNNVSPLNTELNTELNKELNKEISSSFEVSTPKPKMAEEKIKNFNLFRDNSDYDNIPKEVKEQFAEFWKLFNPDESQRCKYKVALLEWSQMSYREACLKLLEKFGKPKDEPNPYFYLQHFAPKFLNEREQYDYCKLPGDKQLCLVRWRDKQKVCVPFVAEVFKLEIIDDHFEKKFQN